MVVMQADGYSVVKRFKRKTKRLVIKYGERIIVYICAI